MKIKHIPVLLKESVDHLITNKNGLYVDCTFGRGGHSREILNRITSDGNLISCDLDEYAEKSSKEILNSNFKFVKTNFSNISEHIKDNNLDGAILDCGISSPQVDDAKRGFSFQASGPLDMRFGKEINITCEEIINHWSEEKLRNIFWEMGEEKEANRIAKRIVEKRKQTYFSDTLQFAKFIETTKKIKTKRHPATKVFQALRMTVNQEIQNLEKCLNSLKPKLVRGGKIVIISFHSLEDRIAKNAFKTIVSKHEKSIPIIKEEKSEYKVSKVFYPDSNEVKMNPRSRSARMRVITKL